VPGPGSPRLPLILLGMSGYVLWDYPAPYGPIVFGSFFLGALWLELAPGRPTLVGQPRRVS
jgi:hypothetical protein